MARLATEAAVAGSLSHHGLLKDAVIVSDGAGQFDVFRHALCWIHAERLIHRLITVSFWAFLGDRLGITAGSNAPLAVIIRGRAAPAHP